jgi:hypothetical protein
MFLPSWNKRMTTSPCYASLYHRFQHLCNFLGSIPSDQPQLQKHPSETIYGILKTETASMLATKTGLKDLAKENPEANWEIYCISCIHNDPYPSALSTEETPGLNKVRKLTTTFVKPHKAPKINQVP